MKKIAVIPARGGSKRIPRKNLKYFLGKPIIAYSIEAALNSGLFDEVMVSTEDEEIAEVSRSYGAVVPFLRSEKNADDYATTADVLLEVIAEYGKRGENFDNLCCIYPCAPFVTDEKLIEAYQLMIGMKKESLITAIPIDFPLQRSFFLENDRIVPIFPECDDERTQDLEQTYLDAGQFYFIEVRSLLSKKSLLTDNSGVFIVPLLEAQDIDNQTDWELATIKYKHWQNQKSNSDCAPLDNINDKI